MMTTYNEADDPRMHDPAEFTPNAPIRLDTPDGNDIAGHVDFAVGIGVRVLSLSLVAARDQVRDLQSALRGSRRDHDLTRSLLEESKRQAEQGRRDTQEVYRSRTAVGRARDRWRARHRDAVIELRNLYAERDRLVEDASHHAQLVVRVINLYDIERARATPKTARGRAADEISAALAEVLGSVGSLWLPHDQGDLLRYRPEGTLPGVFYDEPQAMFPVPSSTDPVGADDPPEGDVEVGDSDGPPIVRPPA